MPPIRITVEEFAELAQQWAHDEESSESPAEQSAESQLLSYAASVAVDTDNINGILAILHESNKLDIPLVLEPRCRAFLLKSMNSTN